MLRELPGPLATQVGELVDVVVHRRVGIVVDELVVLHPAQHVVDELEGQLGLFGDRPARGRGDRQQVLDGQRLDLPFGDFGFVERGRLVREELRRGHGAARRGLVLAQDGRIAAEDGDSPQQVLQPRIVVGEGGQRRRGGRAGRAGQRRFRRPRARRGADADVNRASRASTSSCDMMRPLLVDRVCPFVPSAGNNPTRRNSRTLRGREQTPRPKTSARSEAAEGGSARKVGAPVRTGTTGGAACLVRTRTGHARAPTNEEVPPTGRGGTVHSGLRKRRRS